MKVGDMVKQVGWDSSVDRAGGFHFRDRAYWIMSGLVEVISESR